MALLDIPAARKPAARGAVFGAAFGAEPDFRSLVGDGAWFSLPAAVRARFSGTHRAVYAGEMVVRANWLGRAIAQVCRLIGRPLATACGESVPVEVAVWTDPGRGVVWDRTYAFPGRAPMQVTSRKAMAGPGDLMEVTPGGLGMRLTAGVEDGALVFRSHGYFLTLAGVRVAIPDLLTPGAALVTHADLGGGLFRFSMSFTHALAGETIYQAGVFRDPVDSVCQVENCVL